MTFRFFQELNKELWYTDEELKRAVKSYQELQRAAKRCTTENRKDQ